MIRIRQNQQKRIALIHPEFKGGGGESVLVWTIEALKDAYDITVITTDKIDLEFINHFYSRKIHTIDLKVCRIFPFMSLFSRRFYILKRHLVMLYCKRHVNQFDLFFSTQNELDFGTNGIQYIHFPVHGDIQFREAGTTIKNKRWSVSQQIHNFYHRVSAILSGFQPERIRNNTTITNSSWTRDIVKAAYGVDADIVFPPVLSDMKPKSWGEREIGFVCIGWVRPEKQIENIIEIIARVRQMRYDVDLHIIGPVWDKAYSRKLLDLYADGNNWLYFEGELDRATLVSMIERHRFGIHGFVNEHFGIAVAEMVKAGCIVFVPDGGGQREIVGYDKRVIYQDQNDAVEKIATILSNPDTQQILSEEMKLRGARYSVENFMKSIRSAVDGFSYT